MSLMIACILIYQFEMHWSFYLVAIAIYAFQLYFFIILCNELTNDVSKLTGRVNTIGRALAEGIDNVQGTIDARKNKL